MAEPNYDKEKFHLYNFLIEKDLLEQIDNYRTKMPREGNKFPARSDAVKYLLRLALKDQEDRQ